MISNESINNVDDFLAHHGVQGMKWGVRKQQKQAEKKEKARKKANIKMKKIIKSRNEIADLMNYVRTTDDRGAWLTMPTLEKKYAKQTKEGEKILNDYLKKYGEELI